MQDTARTSLPSVVQMYKSFKWTVFTGETTLYLPISDTAYA
jgi:hypothetical protein